MLLREVNQLEDEVGIDVVSDSAVPSLLRLRSIRKAMIRAQLPTA